MGCTDSGGEGGLNVYFRWHSDHVQFAAASFSRPSRLFLTTDQEHGEDYTQEGDGHIMHSPIETGHVFKHIPFEHIHFPPPT